MEIIKKKFKQIKKLIHDGNNYIIIPDETVTYNIKLLLTSDSKNFGFFNVYEDNLQTIIGNDEYTVSGETNSRLIELEKTIQTTNLSSKYWLSTNIENNGLDLNRSIENEIYVYYIDGIEYIDNINDNITYFTLQSNGLNEINSISGNTYMDESIIYNIGQPKVHSDIFIERPTRKVVEPFFRMRYINNLNDLYEYGGGSYFNIINND